MLCAGKLILSSGSYQLYRKAIRVYAPRWQDQFLSSGFLANALQASRDALQTFYYMLCADMLILSDGFLPDVLQAMCVYALRWQKLVSFQRLPNRCIASRSRCTAIIQVHALRWQADPFQRPPTRCIASNLCLCTALARLVPFQRPPGRCIANKSKGTANAQVHALRWQANSFQRLPARCIASNLCICAARARLVSLQRLPGRCIASKSRCTANT
jgi:hypothetical protein